MVKKCRDPVWNEEFQFMLEEPPLEDKIHIEVRSRKSSLFSFLSKVTSHHITSQIFSPLAYESVRNCSKWSFSQESLGHVEINLVDVVHNRRINTKYHLINSRHGMIHVKIQWTVAWWKQKEHSFNWFVCLSRWSFVWTRKWSIF